MRLSPEQRPIVVGVDGSESARNALLWAAREAAARNVPLRVVYGELWPKFPLSTVAAPHRGGGLHATADLVVERAGQEARQLAPRVPVETQVAVGTAEAVLAEESITADTVVVGSRGLGGFAGLLLGSVSRYLSTHAGCPVVVVRGNETPDGPVVVGIDECSAEDDAGLHLAFERAQRRRVPLVAVHAWAPALAPRVETQTWEDFAADSEKRAEGMLASAVEPWASKFPDVSVKKRLSESPPGTALVEACQGAQLLVVGSHSRGALRGVALGSVAQVVLSHAPCPVLVHRGAAR